MRGVRSGGWLLWDVPSQYGFLNILLGSLVPAASAWEAFYLFQGSLLFLTSSAFYVAVRRYTPQSFLHQITFFVILVMAMFFADPGLIGPYPFPSSSVVRFFCCYTMVLTIFLIPKPGLRQAGAIAAAWPIAVFWSAESAFYGTAILAFIIAALFQNGRNFPERLSLVAKYLAMAFASLAAFIAILIIVYRVRLGVTPDFTSHFEYALGYAGGYGYVPFPLNGPGNLLFLVFLGISLVGIGAIRKTGDDNTAILPLAAIAGWIWAIASYYIGRPVPQNITAMLPMIAVATYLAILLSERSKLGAYVWPLKAAAVPLFFLVLIPVSNPAWVNNLLKSEFFSSDISSKLPKATAELQKMVSASAASSKTPLVFYGEIAAPPVFEGKLQLFNYDNWLPVPLQLLEPPISEARREIYMARYLCRRQPKEGLLIYQNAKTYDTTKRLQGFLNILDKFYTQIESRSDGEYTIYRISRFNAKPCSAMLE